VLREDIVGERGELQKELDLVRKKKFDLPEDIQAYRGCVQEPREGVSRWSTRKRRWAKRSEM
jgi:hypothetical protein